MNTFLNDEGPAEFALGAAWILTVSAVLACWPCWRAVQNFWGGAWL